MSWLPPRFQEQAGEVRQCASERADCDAASSAVETAKGWKSQEHSTSEESWMRGKHEQNQYKREAMKAVTSGSAIGAGLHMRVRVHTEPQIATVLDMELCDLMFSLMHLGLALFSFLSTCLFFPFGVEVFVICFFMSEVFSFLFIFTWAHR